jgi:hypothetical protein
MTSETEIKKIASLPLFFILGRPRSGTTLLASLFDAHPNIMLPFECALIINIYAKYRRTKYWDKSILLSFYHDIIMQRKFDSWRVNTDGLKDYLLSLEGEASFETMIKAVYLKFNSFFGKKEIRIIGDKKPVYAIYPKRLIWLFPNARFIYLTRDYRDNILSIKKVDFEAPFTALLAYRWRFAANRIEKIRNKFPHQFYTIRYEDLVLDPSVHLQKMCDFLGIQYDETVLDFYRIKDELLEKFPREHIERYHSSLLNPIDSTRVYGWKKSMPEQDITTADFIVGKHALISGYLVKPGKMTLGILLKAATGTAYGYFAYQLRFLVDHFPFGLKSYIRNKGPLIAVLYNRWILGK